jgi:PPP family 3-phenylpropionic acid transporter
MSMLGERREAYSRVRLGGTIGWGIMAYFAGRIMDQNGIVWAFWIYAAGMAVTLLVSQGLRFGRVETRHSFRTGMRTLLVDRRWVFFLCMAFVCGLGFASINTYQFVYMAEIGASKSLMGLSLTISTLAEVPVMIFGGWLLKRLKPLGMITLGMGLLGLRLLLYSAFNYPAAILVIQLLHGLTFPAIWIAGVAYAHEHAPAGLAATAQGLFGATAIGLGAAAGSFLGGLLMGALGGRGMYLIFGTTVTASALLFLFIQRRMASMPPKSG